MLKNNITRLLALLAVLSFVAASCASDASDTADTSEDDSSETTDDAETTEDAEEGDDDEGTEEGAEGANVLDESKTIYEEAAISDFEEGEAAPSCTGEADGVLQIGGIFPETGNLAFLGPPEFAGTELAVADVNAAGGVLGEDVEWLPGDSSDNGDVANQTVDRHLESGVDAILGAASSGVSFQVIEKITGACKIQFSPANTSPKFTTDDPEQLYFRTAPSDVLQGQILSELIVEDGMETVSIMAIQDPYGEGLLDFTKAPLEEAGVSVVTDFLYDAKAASFDSEVEKITADDPDAIVVIGFEESSLILKALFEAGVSQEQIYLVDGNAGNALGENFPEPGALTGIRGTLPAIELTDEFKDRLLEQDPDLIDFTYAPESYDAVVIMALAAEIAQSDSPSEMAKVINGVTGGGEVCTSYEECKALIDEGTTDIDYDGPSGPQEFSQPGEPTKASFAIKEFG